MTKDEALAIIENKYRTTNDDGLWEAGKTVAARVRELEGRTCDKCANTMRYRAGESLNCTNIPGNYDCGVFGNTCGAWKERT